MKTDICDARTGERDWQTCGKVAFFRISLRNNYWLGDKIAKMDLCREHMEASLKSIGFESENQAKRAMENQWRKTD